jgi:HEAT repeat protein
MGLFDFLKKSSKDTEPKGKSTRDMARFERLVGSKLSQNFDRQDALEQLSQMGTAAAATILLKRFNWSMDPSITDHEEKDLAVQGIAAAAEEAIEPIRDYCKRADSLTWPLKALRQIVQEPQLGEELLALLDQFDTEYVRNIEPKVQLITALRDHCSDDVRVAVEPFLTDTSEPVRFEAAETILCVGDEASTPALVAALEEEESLRVKNRIGQGLAERGWIIPEEWRAACERGLPPSCRLVDGKVVKRT